MPRAVAQLRAALADNYGDPAWRSLIARLRRDSPAFEALWGQHDVQPMHGHPKQVQHPDAGLLTFTTTHLWFGRTSETRLTTFIPADGRTGEQLRAHFGDVHAVDGSEPAASRSRGAAGRVSELT